MEVVMDAVRVFVCGLAGGGHIFEHGLSNDGIAEQVG